MPLPIPASIIEPINEGSPTKKTDDLPNQRLNSPFFEAFITSVGQQIILSSTTPKSSIKYKGKGISFGRIIPIVPLKKKEGWSLEKIDQVEEESLKIQAMKDNVNPFSGISPYYP